MLEDVLGGQAMCAHFGSGPRKREHNVSCFFMFPLSVMNLLLETTLFCTLCQSWLRLEPIKFIKMSAKIFGMDKLSDLGHAGPAICDLISVLRTVQIFY